MFLKILQYSVEHPVLFDARLFCEECKIFENTFYYRTLLVAASGIEIDNKHIK